MVEFVWTQAADFSWLSLDQAEGGGRQKTKEGEEEEGEEEEKHNVVDVRKSSYMQKEEIDEIEANMDSGSITKERRDAGECQL